MSARIADHPVMAQFTDRWSPRAFDPRPMAGDELLRLFEAARWAPSSSNHQPWRFAYAMREDAHWDAFLSALVPFNQTWAGDASALIYVLSLSNAGAPGEEKPNASHSFDAGAAWMSLALQAHDMGLITHGMLGIDMDAAAQMLALPDGWVIEAAIAVGYPGDKTKLPDRLREREMPSTRRPVVESIFHGPIS